MKRNFKVIDKNGFHARTMSKILNIINQFPNDIEIINNNNSKKANFKSIISTMSLGIKYDDEITIIVKDDENNLILDKIENNLKKEKLIK